MLKEVFEKHQAAIIFSKEIDIVGRAKIGLTPYHHLARNWGGDLCSSSVEESPALGGIYIFKVLYAPSYKSARVNRAR